MTLIALLALFASPVVARPLTIGFNPDPVFFAAPEGGTWLERAVTERAGLIRLNVSWAAVARTRPRVADDPGDPAYDWSELDAEVRAVAAHGMQAMITFVRAPPWAEGAGRPSSAPAGTWHPSDGALGDFARAATRRFSGAYPDPARPGVPLPRVRYFQAWNEPNLTTYLAPQWTRSHGRWRLDSPGIYRGMLDAVYSGVKGVRRDDIVVSAGTAPYGDPSAGGQRVAPVLFMRDLLCLRAGNPHPLPCHDPARFDVLAHHPYGIRGPLSHAVNADDAAVSDISKLTRLLRRAERAGTALPRGPHRVWVTEISWDSSPPDPGGVPVQRHARWLEEAFYVLWRQGVDTVLWLQIRDSPPIPDYGSTYQAGLYLLDGTAKPTATAFRFPFVAEPVSMRSASVWGRAPSPGPVAIERRIAGRWRPLVTLRAGGDGLFRGRIARRRGATLRALQGGQTTLSWQQR
jgi:hypothetical protein